MSDEFNEVLDEFANKFPGIIDHPDILGEAIRLQGGINKSNKDRYIFGTKKHKAIYHHVIELLTSKFKSELDKIYSNYDDLVLDWNQKRILKSYIEEKCVTNYLGSSAKLTIQDSDVTQFISKNLPFTKVDTSKIPYYRDYRLPENVNHLVNRNILVRSLCGDTDHYHDCHVGAEYLNLDNEQKAWYALNFGFTYRAQWSSLALQLFPYAHTEDINEVAYWNSQKYNKETNTFTKISDGPNNYDLIIAGKDCKWNRYKFPEFYKSVQDYSEGGNLYEKLKHAATKFGDDCNANYQSLTSELRNNFHGIGRMTAFLAVQQLYEFFNWPVNGNVMGLEESGTWSCRIGALAVKSDLRKVTERQIIAEGMKSPSKELVESLDSHTQFMLESANSYLPFETNVFEYESVSCEITDKYLLKSREFSYWTSIEKSALITESYEWWNKAWKPTEAYPTMPDLKVLFLPQIAKRPTWMPYSWLDPNWMLTLNHLGISSFHNYILKDDVDIESHLPVKSANDVVNNEFVNLTNSLFTADEISEIQYKYDPRRYIRWKKNIDMNSESILSLHDSEVEFIKNLDKHESSGYLFHSRV